jgi:hypothetical protein
MVPTPGSCQREESSTGLQTLFASWLLIPHLLQEKSGCDDSAATLPVSSITQSLSVILAFMFSTSF